jgi:hypothetical protein
VAYTGLKHEETYSSQGNEMIGARNVWVLLYPAQDLGGQWIGHCLDLSVVATTRNAPESGH